MDIGPAILAIWTLVIIMPKTTGEQLAKIMNAYDAARTKTGSEK